MTSARDEIESLLRWWRDAGVDGVVDEVPHVWTMAKAVPAPAPVATTIPALPPAPVHADLAGFVAWLMQPDTLPELGARRLAPLAGPRSLMILLDMPERADLDAGVLLAGETREVFDAMLAALGHDRGSIYLASIFAGRTADGRVPKALEPQAETLARRHVRLAAPQRLWLLGDATSRALLGMNAIEARGRLHQLNLDGLIIPTIATAHPKVLANDPGRTHRRRIWEEMQRLMRDAR